MSDNPKDSLKIDPSKPGGKTEEAQAPEAEEEKKEAIEPDNYQTGFEMAANVHPDTLEEAQFRRISKHAKEAKEDETEKKEAEPPQTTDISERMAGLGKKVSALFKKK